MAIVNNPNTLLGGVLDNLGIDELFNIYKEVNQLKIDKSVNATKNMAEELKASIALLDYQNQLKQAQAVNQPVDFTKWLIIGGIVLGAVVVMGKL